VLGQIVAHIQPGAGVNNAAGIQNFLGDAAASPRPRSAVGRIAGGNIRSSAPDETEAGEAACRDRGGVAVRMPGMWFQKHIDDSLQNQRESSRGQSLHSAPSARSWTLRAPLAATLRREWCRGSPFLAQPAGGFVGEQPARQVGVAIVAALAATTPPWR
jgi:hypothetical protein